MTATATAAPRFRLIRGWWADQHTECPLCGVNVEIGPEGAIVTEFCEASDEGGMDDRGLLCVTCASNPRAAIAAYLLMRGEAHENDAPRFKELAKALARNEPGIIEMHQAWLGPERADISGPH